MCVNCVATGSAYAVPALLGLRFYAHRARRRRTAGPSEGAAAPAVPAGETETAPPANLG